MTADGAIGADEDQVERVATAPGGGLAIGPI
jgi:hypothetical protein